jgi:hypothetical protein
MKINEETGLYENYGLWHVPFWQTETFYFVLKVCAVVIALSVCVGLYKAYVAYKKRKKLPAWDAALRDLSNLKNAHKLDAAQGKEFYLATSSIVKTYLCNRFGYDLLSKTDDEVVGYLQEKKADAELTEDVRALLQGSIVIKFAKAQAAQEKINHDYNRAISIVKKTIPQKK